MCDEQSQKIFGKWHDVILIIITFAFMTIGGGLIGYLLQTRSWHYQNKQNLLASERVAAEKIFSDLCRSMDKRLYRMRKVFWGHKHKDKYNDKDIKKRWEDYRQVLEEWNVNVNKYRILIDRYFGEGISKAFMDIHYEFRWIGNNLENLKDRKDPDFEGLETSLDMINNKTYGFSTQILNAIKNNNFGIFCNPQE